MKGQQRGGAGEKPTGSGRKVQPLRETAWDSERSREELRGPKKGTPLTSVRGSNICFFGRLSARVPSSAIRIRRKIRTARPAANWPPQGGRSFPVGEVLNDVEGGGKFNGTHLSEKGGAPKGKREAGRPMIPFPKGSSIKRSHRRRTRWKGRKEFVGEGSIIAELLVR